MIAPNEEEDRRPSPIYVRLLTEYWLRSLAIYALIILVGWFFGRTGLFVSFLLIALHFGRMIDNKICTFLLLKPRPIYIWVGLVSGVVLAVIFRWAIVLGEPNIVFKVIAYLLGGYLSMIEYIGINSPTPEYALLNICSCATYAFGSIVLHFCHAFSS